MSTVRVIGILDAASAGQILHDAWWGGKNAGLRPVRFAFHAEEDGLWAHVEMPLSWVAANEAGDRYDGTVSLERARRYAGLAIKTPVHLCFSKRNTGQTAGVNDGGHRVSAARMAGATYVPALLRLDQLRRLLDARGVPYPAEVLRTASCSGPAP